MDTVIALTLLGIGAYAQDVSCTEDTTCPEGMVCVTDSTDRSGRTGTCSRPSQWPGEPCSATVGGLGDNCDREQNLICVTGNMWEDEYQCQTMKTVLGDGCLSTAASYESQCADGMVCVVMGLDPLNTDSYFRGTCQNAQEELGGACAPLVRSGPGYVASSCAGSTQCYFDQCVQVSQDGQCNDDWGVSWEEYTICPEGQLCEDEQCVPGPTPQFCWEEADCQSNEVCVSGTCRPAASDGEPCNQDIYSPISEQAWCDMGLCLKKGDDAAFMCYPDQCFGSCSDLAVCDMGQCRPKQECEVDEQNACCVPTKQPSATCDADTRSCVCAFDEACCSTDEGAPGWDFYCIEGARTFCALKC